MKRTVKKRLALESEHVRIVVELSPAELRRVGGGESPDAPSQTTTTKTQL